MGFEQTLDAKTFDGNSYIDFYSIAANQKLTIQSRSLPFANTDAVPLGYKTTVAGAYKIKIDHADGLFLGNQNVYLKDNLLNIIHDIKATEYSFSSSAGTFNNRFEIVYINPNIILTPTFTQVSAICPGATLAALPTISTNGINGNWSPALNNTTTTTYTFTPTAGQFATTATMTIVVNQSLAGTISANQTVVSGAQPDIISLTNSNGAVQWQSSTNNILFSDIVGAPDSPTLSGETIGALTANKYFRAIVNNGGCGNVTSTTVSVTVITSTKIKDAFCGTTLPTIKSQIQAYTYPSAQLYRFEVSNNGNVMGTIELNKSNFDLLKIPGTTYGQTYSIKVAVRINNVWGVYGPYCNVTTPSIVSSFSVPLTQIRASQCGSTLDAIGSPIHSELVYGAEAYRFELTNGTTVTEVESPIYYFFLTNTAIGTFGTTFSIKTKAKIAGVWGNYGVACTISTPVLVTNTVPLTQVRPSMCGTTLAALNTKIPAVIVYSAEGYRFEITNGETVIVYDSVLYNPNLLDAGIVPTNGATYSIRIAAKIKGVFGNYGVSCNVTMPGAAINAKQTTDTTSIETIDFDLVAYPNPSNSIFKLQVSGATDEEVSILVFDMVGKEIDSKVVKANDIENVSFGQNYASGVYILIAAKGMNTKTIRLVKR